MSRIEHAYDPARIRAWNSDVRDNWMHSITITEVVCKLQSRSAIHDADFVALLESCERWEAFMSTSVAWKYRTLFGQELGGNMMQTMFQLVRVLKRDGNLPFEIGLRIFCHAFQSIMRRILCSCFEKTRWSTFLKQYE